MPDNPGAWITTTARNRAIDRLRRRKRLAEKEELLRREAAIEEELAAIDPDAAIDGEDGMSPIADDRLRLIFTCCHPALAMDAPGGADAADARRAVDARDRARLPRARADARPAARPGEAEDPRRRDPVPRSADDHALPERLDGVLRVLYLVFNEGYGATAGDRLIRRELCAEAIRLTRVLASLMPDEPEVLGLLALMLLHDARRETRTGPGGELVLLDDQDRAALGPGPDRRGPRRRSTGRCGCGGSGPYQLQAAIAALHDDAATTEETDWAADRGALRASSAGSRRRRSSS